MRQAVRALGKHPGFAVPAILTLALGIGGITAVFSVVNAVLVQPLPYPRSDRLVMLLATFQGGGSFPGVSAPKFTEWQRSADLEDAAAYLIGGVMNLTGRDRAEQIGVGRASSGFFRLFGARFMRGRAFTAEEDRPGGPRVAIISHGFWQRHWGAVEAVGDSLSIDDTIYRIVGVLERGFDAESLSLSMASPPDVWLPLQLEPLSESDAPFFAAARVRDGIALEAARAQAAAAASTLRKVLPAVMPAEAGLTVEPLQTVLVRDVRTPLWLLLFVVGFVLLIVCANTANLSLVRASARQREIAIRLATGATRARIVRQLLAESLALSAMAGALGLALAS